MESWGESEAEQEKTERRERRRESKGREKTAMRGGKSLNCAHCHTQAGRKAVKNLS